jgi:hypothetical protein
VRFTSQERSMKPDKTRFSKSGKKSYVKTPGARRGYAVARTTLPVFLRSSK